MLGLSDNSTENFCKMVFFFLTRLSAINVQLVFLRRQYIVLTFCLFGFEIGSRMVQAHFEVAMLLVSLKHLIFLPLPSQF